MPYKPRGRGGRRGRPPKRHSISPAQKHGLSYTGDEARSASAYSSGLTISLKATQDTQPYSSTLTTPTSATYKPREERSYKDFFPDLNIKQPLIIVRHHQNSITDSTMTHPTTTTTTTSLAMNNTSPSTPQPPPSSTSSNSGSSNQSLGDLDDVSDLSKDEASDDSIIVPTSSKIATPITPTPPIITTPINNLTTTTDIDEQQMNSSALEDEEDDRTGMIPSTPSTAEQSWTASPKVIHGDQKEGDTYQALSTRPQTHHTTASGAVDLSSLPKPKFKKVIDDEDDISIDQDIPRKKKKSTTALNKLRQLRKNKTDNGTSDNGSDDMTDGTIDDDDDDEHHIHKDTVPDDDDRSIEQGIMTFQRPENHYIRYIEPTEEELFDMVEYDMDEQDETWLQMLNAERRKDDLGEVSCSFFENVIDKLEKEWFDLVKNLPKQVNDEPSLPEDSSCAICDDGECENSNAIVFCDGCNLAVHQDCYGVPYIPEGQWLCRKCMVSPDKPVTCLFCPNEGGAFKQTNTNKWGHLLCAIWIPEVGVSNSVYMEPIDNIDSIPKSRWKLTCYICRKRHGACIQCDNKHCFTAFHVTCARWARLCMRMKSHGSHYDSVLLKAYCDRHTPRDYREEVDVEKCVLAAQKFLDPKSAKNRGRSTSSYTPRRRYVDEFLLENGEEDGHFSQDDNDDFGDDDDDDDVDGSSGQYRSRRGRQTRRGRYHSHVYKKRKLSLTTTSSRKQKQKQDQVMPVAQLTPSLKAARAHQHHYSAGAPIAPDYILTRLEQIKLVRQATHLKKRSQLIASICRYWSLKRESRRGAPLLKRLHLEPWTASSSQLKQTEVEKAHKASAMMSLRADLEVVRMLSEQVQKREKQKLERIRRQKEYVEMVLFPVEYIVKPILNQLMEMDKKDFFLYPVTTDVAPDYFNIIDKPMAFSDIIDKFHAHEYSTLDDVEADLSLIWKNCKTYNRSDTSYYRLAQRMEEQAKEWMTQARQDYNMLEISLQAGTLAVGIDPDIFSYDLIQPSPEPSHDSYDNQQKELEISKQEPQQELDQQMHQETGKKKNEKELSLPSTRSDRKKQLPSSTSSRRTTRSSSTGLIELSLDKYLSEKSRKSKRARKAATASTDVSDKSNSISSTSFTSALSSNTSSDRSPEIMVTPSSSLPTSPSPQPQLSQETEKNTRKIKKKDKAISTVTRRMTRSAGSEGLTVPTKSAMKNSKMNSETRKLLWSDSVTKPIAYVEGSYKESKTKRAPRGYVYISSSDEDGSNDEEQGDNSMIKTTNATSIISPSSKRNKKSNKLSHGKQPLEVEPLSTFAHLQTTTIEKVVWARVSGFPFHPAKIVDPNKEDVPKNVRTGKPKAQSSLVKFFMVPENHQWGWIRTSDLYLFGDKTIDYNMLLRAKHHKKNIKKKWLDEVMKGYIYACRQLGIEPQQIE